MNKLIQCHERLTANVKSAGELGILGGVQAFAKSNRLNWQEAYKLLQHVLNYMLHCPREKHFPTLSTLLCNIDEQWVANLIELQWLAR